MSNLTSQRSESSNQRRVAAATLIGTTIEWYDFFIYATMAGLIFGQLFFQPAGEEFARIASFASVGISFLFRPLGAYLAGHYGDKLGRRLMLVITLILMGAATTLIGVLPTYAQAGIIAPILLLVLRILQGVSAGGEWGGAALMAVEHAPRNRRGLAGSAPQLGVPLGMLLASLVTALVTGVIAPGDAFVEWGWRIPFLISIVLIVVGYFVRKAVDESPVFVEMAAKKEQQSAPTKVLFRRHWLLVLLAALVFVGNNANGYMITGGFVLSYTTDPTQLNMPRTDVLLAVSMAAVVWMIFTVVAGALSDRIGRPRTYQIGYIWLLAMGLPLFWMINTGSLGLIYLSLAIFAVGLGLTYGPQAAMYSEVFPADVRFSGVSIAYALGAILGGAFSPMIAQALLQATGGTTAISLYLMGMSVVAFIAVSLFRDRRGMDLSINNQAVQEVGTTVFDHRDVPAAYDTTPAGQR